MERTNRMEVLSPVPEADAETRLPRRRQTRRIRVEADGCEHTFPCDAIAALNSRLLYLSFAGPATAVKALRAVIQQPDVPFTLQCREYDHPFGTHDTFTREGGGYRSYSHPLGLNTWHMVLVTKIAGFLPCVD